MTSETVRAKVRLSQGTADVLVLALILGTMVFSFGTIAIDWALRGLSVCRDVAAACSSLSPLIALCVAMINFSAVTLAGLVIHSYDRVRIRRSPKYRTMFEDIGKEAYISRIEYYTSVGLDYRALLASWDRELISQYHKVP